MNREGRGFPKVTEPARAHLLTEAGAVVTKPLTAFLDVTVRGQEDPRRRRRPQTFMNHLETYKHDVSLHFSSACPCAWRTTGAHSKQPPSRLSIWEPWLQLPFDGQGIRNAFEPPPGS